MPLSSCSCQFSSDQTSCLNIKMKTLSITHMGFSSAQFVHADTIRSFGSFPRFEKSWKGLNLKSELIGDVFRQHFAGAYTTEQSLFCAETLTETTTKTILSSNTPVDERNPGLSHSARRLASINHSNSC
jgi:hypothetical protein